MERPAKAGAKPHRVVDLAGGGDVVVHQPQRLAPHRLHQPIGDEPVDLGAQPGSGCMPTGAGIPAARSMVAGVGARARGRARPAASGKPG